MTGPRLPPHRSSRAKPKYGTRAMTRRAAARRHASDRASSLPIAEAVGRARFASFGSGDYDQTSPK
jgi:hypothetical protein